MSTHTEVTALEKRGLPETLRTLVISPERELEPGMRVKARFTVGDGPPGAATVTLRVGFESDSSKGGGSTAARWTITPNEEIELIVELPGNGGAVRAAPSETKREEHTVPASQQALPPALPVSSPALRLLEETRFPGLVRHLFALRALLPEEAFPAKLRGQLDRLFIKLRLPNYAISDRDIDASSQTWIDIARQLSAGEFAVYRARIITALEYCVEPEAFITALQQSELPELDAELDALLDRMRPCS